MVRAGMSVPPAAAECASRSARCWDWRSSELSPIWAESVHWPSALNRDNVTEVDYSNLRSIFAADDNAVIQDQVTPTDTFWGHVPRLSCSSLERCRVIG